HSKSPIAHVLVLTPSPVLAARVVETYGGEVDARCLDRYLGTYNVFPRTTWFNEICHRYLFERSICGKRDNDATRFLETEIVKEVYFLSHERATRDGDGAKGREEAELRERALMHENEGKLVERAVKEIEARLFDADVVSTLPSICGASESTLLRAFKRE